MPVALAIEVLVSFFGALVLSTYAGKVGSALRTILTPLVLFIPGVSSLVNAIEGALAGLFDPAQTTYGARVADGLNTANKRLATALAQPGQALLAVQAALTKLWTKALPAKIEAELAPVRTKADAATAHLTALAETVTDNLAAAKTYADTQVAKEDTAVRAYVRTEIDAAKSAVQEYADDAVAKLQASEDTAIQHADAISQAAQTSADAAMAKALEVAKSVAVPLPAPGTAAPPAAAPGAVAQPAPGASPFPSLDQLAGVAGAAGLIASIPALSTLVTAVATESGLSNQACRGKVKQICNTDPAAWEGLLAGIAAVGIAFSLQDIVDAATAIFDESAALIQAAA